MSSKAHDAPRRLSRIQSPGPRVVRQAVDCGNVDAYLATERALPQGAKDPTLPADPLPELSQATCSVILCFAPASPGGQIRSLQSSCSGAVIVGYDVETPAVVSQNKKTLGIHSSTQCVNNKRRIVREIADTRARHGPAARHHSIFTAHG